MSWVPSLTGVAGLYMRQMSLQKPETKEMSHARGDLPWRPLVCIYFQTPVVYTWPGVD